MKHFLLLIVVLFAATAIFPQKTVAVKKTSARKSAIKKTIVSDKDAFKKASELADASEKIDALKKFLTDYPESSQKAEAQVLLATTRVSFADEKVKSGDIDSAAALYQAAVDEAPSPASDKLFTESFAKIPTTLFWQGKRTEALDIAKKLSSMAEGSTPSLLALADFYLGIESGADAKALAEKAVALDANSAKAYSTLATADRLDFRIEDSATAYAKALELDPTSDATRRSLADMKRALGKPDEAETLYREILAKDAANIPAQTGLALSLFDEGKTADAESEMAKSLEQNPNNMILLAGAAYWYAAHGNGDKAVELAGKAVETEPRYIWSHIALARGYMAKKQPAEAERVLIKARQYGRFPTLEYELASARRMSGFYREAAEDLRKSFSVKDGMVVTDLGGRVPAENKSFTDLLAAERRASIFEPTAADDAQNADTLKALLQLDQTLRSDTPDEAAVTKATDAFVGGDDTMTLYRRLYAASALLQKKVALGKVVDITNATIGTADTGFDAADPGAAVMASELYDSRTSAFARGEYIIVPNVPRQTLSAILRGRIEELAGWALYYQNQPAEAIVRLKRAISVLPENSAWWRSSMWRLGAALQVEGNDAEALDSYIKSYKGDKPDELKYTIVEALYKKVNGGTSGLEKKIGQTHMFNQETAQNAATQPEPTPTATPEAPVSEPAEQQIPRNVPMKIEPKAAPEIVPESASAVPTDSPQTETAVAKIADTIAPPPTASPEPTPEATPTASPEPTPITETTTAKVTETPAPSLPEPSPTASPTPETAIAKTTDNVAPTQTEPEPAPTATPEPMPESTPDPGIMKNVSPGNEEKPAPTTDTRSTAEKPANAETESTDQGSQEKKVETVTDTTAQPAVTPTPTPVTTETPLPESKNDAATETKPDPTTELPKETTTETTTDAIAQSVEKPTRPEPQPTETPVQKTENTDQPPKKTTEPPPTETAKNEPSNNPAPVSSDTAIQKSNDEPARATEDKTSNTSTASKSIFEPIIINVPKSSPQKSASQTKLTPDAKPDAGKLDSEANAPNKAEKTFESTKPQSRSGETRPRIVAEKPLPDEPQKCSINLSRERVSIVNGAGSVGILVSLDGKGNLKTLTSASSSPNDVEVVLEPEIAGAADKAFYLINSISPKKGIYQIAFELPCGQKTLTVTVY